MSRDEMKVEIKDVRKNYTRTPNILFESYPDLHPQEKWLYINLVYLCGASGTRHLSLRYISQRTGISVGALSGWLARDAAKKDRPGMIRNLHNAGLIHAEIKKVKSRDGSEKDQAQYHITITDIWQMNINFFAERSQCEHLEEKSVHNVNTLDEERSQCEQERSQCEQERSHFDTNIRLHSKITKQEEESSSTEAQPEPIATSHEVAAPTLFSEEADAQASPIAATKSGARKPRQPVDETLKARVEKVYTYFDALAQETSGDTTYRYQRTKKATDAITQWLKGTPTEELLREVYLQMWAEPANPRTGFQWKNNMKIHSVLAEYDSRSLAIKAKRHAAQPKPATLFTQAAKHVDDDEPLQYRPFPSQIQKARQQSLAAARRS